MPTVYPNRVGEASKSGRSVKASPDAPIPSATAKCARAVTIDGTVDIAKSSQIETVWFSGINVVGLTLALVEVAERETLLNVG